MASCDSSLKFYSFQLMCRMQSKNSCNRFANELIKVKRMYESHANMSKGSRTVSLDVKPLTFERLFPYL